MGTQDPRGSEPRQHQGEHDGAGRGAASPRLRSAARAVAVAPAHDSGVWTRRANRTVRCPVLDTGRTSRRARGADEVHGDPEGTGDSRGSDVGTGRTDSELSRV